MSYVRRTLLGVAGGTQNQIREHVRVSFKGRSLSGSFVKCGRRSISGERERISRFLIGY